jgi:hypothetical protein
MSDWKARRTRAPKVMGVLAAYRLGFLQMEKVIASDSIAEEAGELCLR